MSNVIQLQWAQLGKDIKAAPDQRISAILRNKKAALKPALQAEWFNRGRQHVDRTETIHETVQETSSIVSFNYYLIPGSDNARMLCGQIYSQWLQHKKYVRMPSEDRRQEFKAIISCIVSNILYAELTGHEGVRVTREQSFLGKQSRYRPNAFNQRSLDVMDELHALGVINQIRGEKWGRSQLVNKTFGVPVTARQTELHSTPALHALASSCGVAMLEDFTVQTDRQEIVILKRDKSSLLVEYEDTPQTDKLRRQVKIINRKLESAGTLLTPEHGLHHDQRQRFLVRKFTYGSFESGGRFSGGFWMNMRRTERPVLLRINGEKTVEIDYTAIMTRTAYVVADAPLPHDGDLYSIPGLSPESRPGIKKFLSALYFKKTKPTKFPQGVADLLAPEDRARGCAYVLRQIEAAHPRIAHLFCTEVGHYLQHLESRLMVNVLLYCAKYGITCLPIHDCCVVTQSQRDRVRGIMESMGAKVLGRRFPCEEKIGGKEDIEETGEETVFPV